MLRSHKVIFKQLSPEVEAIMERYASIKVSNLQALTATYTHVSRQFEKLEGHDNLKRKLASYATEVSSATEDNALAIADKLFQLEDDLKEAKKEAKRAKAPVEKSVEPAKTVVVLRK